jgi:hypothetical protein
MCTSDWFATGYFNPYFVVLGAFGFFLIKVLRLVPSSALLRLTSLQPVTHLLKDQYLANILPRSINVQEMAQDIWGGLSIKVNGHTPIHGFDSQIIT